MAAIEMIAVGKLKLADDNVRTNVGDIRELTASIKSLGVIEPLIAREGDYVVVAGSRRLAAAKKAGLKEVPTIVRSFTDGERVAVMLVENLQRDDLTPLEEAGGYARLVELGLKQQEIAKKVGCSQGTVAKRLALLTLPAPIRKEVASGKIKLEDAGELAKLKDDPKLLQKVAMKAAEYGGIPAAVDREIEKKRRQKQVEIAGTELAKKGETVVKLAGDQWSVKPPKGCKLVLKEPPSYYTSANFIVMDPAKHAKLDCHLVGVHPTKLTPVEVCGAPSNHPDPEAEKKADKDKREAEVAEAREAFVAITAKRREFVRSLAAPQHGPDKELVLELVYLTLMLQVSWGYGFEREMIACQLAGVELPVPAEADELGEGGEGEGDDDPIHSGDVPDDVADLLDEEGEPVSVDEAMDAEVEDMMEALQRVAGKGLPVSPEQLLQAQAEKGATDRLRVTFALAAASFEVNLGRVSYRYAGEYLELLVKRGYELDSLEKKLLDEQ